MDYFLLCNTSLVFYRPATPHLSDSNPCKGRVCLHGRQFEIVNFTWIIINIILFNEINAVVWNQGIVYRDAFND